MKESSAGTYSSCDCVITIKEYVGIKIEIESVVDKQFHDSIYAVILNTLNENRIKNVEVFCQDKGALDYVIRARVITAISRYLS